MARLIKANDAAIVKRVHLLNITRKIKWTQRNSSCRATWKLENSFAFSRETAPKNIN